MEAEDWVLLIAGGAIVLLLGMMIAGQNFQDHAACSEFKNFTIKNVPARCISTYQK